MLLTFVVRSPHSATAKSSQDKSVILARNFLIREVFSYGMRGEVRWA